MGGLAWWHWLLIIAAFILLFGAKKLPDAARGLGRSLRILKSEVNAMHEDDGKRETKPAETDASAQVATPTAQLAPTPVPAVSQIPTQPAAQPVPQPVVTQAPAQPAHAAEAYPDPTRPAGT